MSPLDDNTTCDNFGWCAYEAIDDTSIMIEQVYLGIVCAFGVIILWCIIRLCKYMRDPKVRQLLGKMPLLVFVCLLIWLLMTIMKLSVNIKMYPLINHSKIDYQISPPLTDKQHEDLLFYSLFYDGSNMFMVTYLILLLIAVPTKWMQFFLDISIQQEADEQNGIPLSIKDRKLINWGHFGIKFIKIVTSVRVILATALYIYQMCEKQENNFVCSLIQENNSIILISEAGLILTGYLLGYMLIMHLQKKKLLHRMQEKTFNKIKREYMFFWITQFIRLIYHIALLLKLNENDKNFIRTQTCSDKYNTTQRQYLRASFLIVDHIFMQLMAVGIIIYVYFPSLKKIRHKTLLVTSDIIVNTIIERTESDSTF